MKTKPFLSTKQLVLCGLMTGILCILAPFSLPLPLSPVPVSLATFVLYISACVLGCRLGTVSCVIYLLLGLAGLPVFSGFSGGLGKLAGPTGGYLIGYLFLAFIGGFAVDFSGGKRFGSALGFLAGTAITYTFGTVWLSLQMDLTFVQGLAAGVIPYLPGDAVKIIAALTAGPAIRNRLKQITNMR